MHHIDYIIIIKGFLGTGRGVSILQKSQRIYND